jgi:hypothetical protein
MGGAPRLIVCVAGDGTLDHALVNSAQVFFLRSRVTTLGAEPDADIQLAGSDARFGEVVHDGFDEYVFQRQPSDAVVRINGQKVLRHPLRTGDRLELGAWTLMYFREEYADHGRPYGGRQGGEGAVQRPQPPRSAVTPAAEPSNLELRTKADQS